MASQSTFGLSDFLTRKAARFMPLSYGPHVPTCIKITSSFVFQNIVFTNTNKRTDGRTDGQVENMMPPASLNWQRYKQ